jgi:hypothetical protein
MALRRYEYYPASPESIRGAAGGVRTGSSNLHGLVQSVESQHRAVVGSTQGDLVAPLSQGMIGPSRLASAVSRRALWAAAQLEVFADAIEVYNRDSSDPWSIEKLNQKVDLASPEYFCLTVPGPDADAAEREAFNRQYQTRLAAHQIELDTHFVRLEADLDLAAAGAAVALRREPTDADVIALWKAGNLPAYAALAWPELNLRSIPITGVDPDLLDLSAEEIIALLRNPATPLSDAELEWLAVSNPDLMRRFHDEWTLQDTVLLPPGQDPAGYPPGSSEHGWILGPDGRWYPIAVPEAPTPGDHPSFVAGPGGLHSGNGNWVTLDSRQGRLYLGEPPPTALLILSGMTGYTPNIYGNLSVGENQTDYLTYDQHGNVIGHQQATDRGPAWSPPPSVPDPELSQAPPGTWDPTASDNAALDRLNRVSSLVDLGVGGLKGLQLSHQIHANNSYAGNVVFQTSGDQLRAVIQAAQVTYDPETGKVVEDPYRRYATAEDVNQELSGDLDAPQPMPTPTPIPDSLPVPELTEPGPQPGPAPTPPR